MTTPKVKCKVCGYEGEYMAEIYDDMICQRCAIASALKKRSSLDSKKKVIKWKEKKMKKKTKTKTTKKKTKTTTTKKKKR